MVTGTGAINTRGIRVGKGHSFFDLEWAILYALGVVHQSTIALALVHDCQPLEEELVPEDFDTVCDIIVTPTYVLEIADVQKPTGSVLWPLLQPGMLQSIPPLQELKTMINQEL
jgi:5-formyltetrahydrofolate cyclo-ligase